MTSWKAASVRARTRPGATRWADVLSDDRTINQQAPMGSSANATSSAHGR